MLVTMIPAKSFARAKQRLGGIASAEQREAIARALLARTVRVVRQAVGPDAPVIVVSDGPDVADVALPAGADRVFVSETVGLNPQLADAAGHVPPGDDLLVIHADLPLLSAEDVVALTGEGLIGEEASPVVLASDRRGLGTNALLLRGPKRFFLFGSDSAARHRAAATAHGLAVSDVARPGLAFDLDEEQDWAELRHHLGIPEGPDAARQIAAALAAD